MADELTVDNQNLISSKRASELSGYAQDYIGQLARKGLIRAKRLSGLWYVSLDSLNAYKSNAENFKPIPPQATSGAYENDAIISFDGGDYVSAARAAQLTGYHQDYVGQLARTGKILSRQIGNRWYVNREEILAHKSEKDALLGAVQSESVGITKARSFFPDESEKKLPVREPYFTYVKDENDLVPKTQEAEKRPIPSYDLSRAVYSQPALRSTSPGVPVTIHKHVEPPESAAVAPARSYYEAPRVRRPRSSIPIMPLATLFTVVLIFGVGILNKQEIQGIFRNNIPNTRGQTAFSNIPARIMQATADWIEGVLGSEINYRREK